MCFISHISIAMIFLWIYFLFGFNFIQLSILYIKIHFQNKVNLFLIILLLRNLLQEWKKFMLKVRKNKSQILRLIWLRQKQFVWDFLLLQIKYGKKCSGIKLKAKIQHFLSLKELVKRFKPVLNHWWLSDRKLATYLGERKWKLMIVAMEWQPQRKIKRCLGIVTWSLGKLWDFRENLKEKWANLIWMNMMVKKIM